MLKHSYIISWSHAIFSFYFSYFGSSFWHMNNIINMDSKWHQMYLSLILCKCYNDHGTHKKNKFVHPHCESTPGNSKDSRHQNRVLIDCKRDWECTTIVTNINNSTETHLISLLKQEIVMAKFLPACFVLPWTVQSAINKLARFGNVRTLPGQVWKQKGLKELHQNCTVRLTLMYEWF